MPNNDGSIWQFLALIVPFQALAVFLGPFRHCPLNCSQFIRSLFSHKDEYQSHSFQLPCPMNWMETFLSFNPLLSRRNRKRSSRPIAAKVSLSFFNRSKKYFPSKISAQLRSASSLSVRSSGTLFATIHEVRSPNCSSDRFSMAFASSPRNFSMASFTKTAEILSSLVLAEILYPRVPQSSHNSHEISQSCKLSFIFS